jgi:hypothetical protein
MSVPAVRIEAGILKDLNFHANHLNIVSLHLFIGTGHADRHTKFVIMVR